MPKKSKPTVRERAAGKSDKKPRRIKVSHKRVSGPLKKATKVFQKIRIPLPNNKFGNAVRSIGRLLSKVLLLGYFKASWKEIRQVSWPTRKETVNLTIAVFIFSVIFTTIVAILDFGLDKLFKELIIK